ncbi:MAG TPA: glycosyl hydrolase family 65 protein [Verrucomicrobiae bacterium]|nr:glycosyl hydrolase family 65 protein [Verrucomicrobiae bacterium]
MATAKYTKEMNRKLRSGFSRIRLASGMGRALRKPGFRNSGFGFLFACFVLLVVPVKASAEQFTVLKPAAFGHYIERFNSMEDENITNFISNSESWNWLQKEIPFFECPDREVDEMYYYRWWSFRKHVVKTPRGFVFTEFLTPVGHAGAFNTISCAAGFHLAEARWLRDPRYVQDYIRFWLRGDDGKPEPHFHKYSSWFASAVYGDYLVNDDPLFTTNLLADLIADYQAWQQEHQLTNGLFWQYDVRDGMEESISGSRHNRNMRPTINSYMYGNGRAIAAIARLAGNETIAREFDRKAADLQMRVENQLWNPRANFFEVRRDDGNLSNVREEIGFIPWMFELPEPGRGYESAWTQLDDPDGFRAPYGITTAERRSPFFRSHGVGNCEWDGAVWPFATSQTLDALANVLRDYPQHVVTKRDWFDAFLTYVKSQHANGKPYIGEYLDEVTGDWINGKGGRSRYYNHSTFADLLIAGLVGLTPRADNVVEISPLLPDGIWNWFCLDGVRYHGRSLAILWDKDGSHYHRGAGLTVWADGKEIARAEHLEKLTGKLP